MTQTAIVRGFARWADKNMTDKFTAGGLTRIGFNALTILAETNPALAMQMLVAKYPSFMPLFATVKDAASFGSVWDALTESVKKSGCVTFDVREAFPFNGRIQTFRFRDADLGAIRAEMEKAYKEEVAVAQTVVTAGGDQSQRQGESS